MDIKELKYVCGHAGNGVLPVFQFLHVYSDDSKQRRAQVTNGRYTVDVPTDLPECTVHAEKIVAAWSACDGEPEATTTDANLMVKRGRVRARMPLMNGNTYPRTAPDPKTAHAAAGISAMLTMIQPFVATDASRPWATSVCLHNGFAYATNNVVLVRAPFPAELTGAVNLPLAVFDAVIAAGEPCDIGATENAITFYFESGVWVRSTLISGDWPTAKVDEYVTGIDAALWETPHPDLGRMLATAHKVSEAKHPVVQLGDSMVKLTDDAFEADELGPLPDAGRVNALMAALVFEKADAVQWHTPKQDVHTFRVGALLGVMAGQR